MELSISFGSFIFGLNHKHKHNSYLDEYVDIEYEVKYEIKK